ncbi:transposase DDE domain protein [Acinetobacter sp. 1475718]|nr:transposase DDE domain protein [Acinetobacter sp. 1475718]
MNKSTPKIYRTTNWSSYNRALINRGNIAIWFDPATQWYAPSKGKQGRNQTYSDAAIQCCLMIKSYSDYLYAWSQALCKVSSNFAD